VICETLRDDIMNNSLSNICNDFQCVCYSDGSIIYANDILKQNTDQDNINMLISCNNDFKTINEYELITTNGLVPVRQTIHKIDDTLFSISLQNIVIEKELNKYKENIVQIKDNAATFKNIVRCLVHEMRNPINSLTHGIDLFNVNKLSDKALSSYNKNDLIRIIHLYEPLFETQRFSIEMTDNILSNFLDFEKINEEFFTMKMSTQFNLNSVMNDIKTLTYSLETMYDKSINYNFKNEHIFIEHDIFRIKQILLNTISNAIYHSTTQSISVHLYIDEMNSQMHFSVKNDCDENLHNRIYSLCDPFVRCNDYSNTGTGLGMYICKHIVTKLNGVIDLNVNKGQLTTKLCIPINILNTSTNTNKKILIVDDFVGTKSTKLLLEAHGMTVYMTQTCKGTLDICGSVNLDVILMDYSLQNITGVDIINEIYSKFPKISTKIIGFTGRPYEKEINDFKQCGVDNVLVKPIDINKLKSLIY